MRVCGSSLFHLTANCLLEKIIYKETFCCTHRLNLCTRYMMGITSSLSRKNRHFLLNPICLFLSSYRSFHLYISSLIRVNLLCSILLFLSTARQLSYTKLPFLKGQPPFKPFFFILASNPLASKQNP